MVRPSQSVDPQRSPRHLVGATIRHWRQQVRDIALTEFAQTLPIDPSQLSKWERAEVPIPADQAARIDNALGAGGQIIALHEQATELDRLRRIHGTEMPTDRATLGAGPLPPERDDDVKRRAAIQLITAVTTRATIPPQVLENVLVGVDAAAGNPIDLDEWDAVVADHGHQIYHHPPRDCVADITADLVQVGRLLDRDNPPHMHTGLCRDSAGAKDALAKLNDTCERLPSPPGPEQSVFLFRESQLQFNQAHVLASLDDGQAGDAISGALKLYPHSAHGPVTNLGLVRSRALIGQREVVRGMPPCHSASTIDRVDPPARVPRPHAARGLSSDHGRAFHVA